MKKPQNFFVYLDGLSIDIESLKKELMVAHDISRDLANMTQKEIEGERPIDKYDLSITNSKTREEFIEKEKEFIKNSNEQAEQIEKFIEFLDAEEKEYEKITKTKKYKDWLADESTDAEDFFDDIEFVPAYIDKKCKIKVLDFVEILRYILDILTDDIEEFIGYGNFPRNQERCVPLPTLLQAINKKNKIKIKEKDFPYYVNLVIAYEDIEYLINIIGYDIEKINEPVKL